ncbi:methylenetetrahydrofolate reductase [Cytophagaceae bacterium ABcell3]|nr:methylenetetrahydrofolate reductase [Cytophagaceae bacterium ABcell3]
MLTYGITPPKANNTEEKVQEIAKKQIDRIKNLNIDALIIYDIQDESDRISDDRPYPFLPTMDPKKYADSYLNEINVPKVLFKCVGNCCPNKLSKEIREVNQKQHYVFVGPSSSSQKVSITLPEAYKLIQKSDLINLGGIMIPERHQKKNDEHIRVRDKIKSGCNFFISQAVYHAEASKNFLSDYHYLCEHTGLEKKPIIFTLTLCGSPKTLEFLKWLGVSIPKWVENDLLNAQDILQKSYDISYQIYKELSSFAKDKGIPVGFNVESVAIKKDEIEASLQLLNHIHQDFQKQKEIKGLFEEVNAIKEVYTKTALDRKLIK